MSFTIVWRWLFLVLALLAFGPKDLPGPATLWAAITVRDSEKLEADVSNETITLTGLSVGDGIAAIVAGTAASSRDYGIADDCAGNAWTNEGMTGTYDYENGAVSDRHVMAWRLLNNQCAGSVAITIDETATFYGYSFGAVAWSCGQTCTADASSTFDNAAGGANARYSAAVGAIDIGGQAMAVAGCSSTGTVVVTIPTGFSDFTGSIGSANYMAYKTTTGSEADQRGEFTETNQRAADCLIFSILAPDAGGGASVLRGTLLGILP